MKWGATIWGRGMFFRSFLNFSVELTYLREGWGVAPFFEWSYSKYAITSLATSLWSGKKKRVARRANIRTG